MRLLYPLFAVAAAIGLALFVMQPIYTRVTVLRAEYTVNAESIENATVIIDKHAKLEETYNKIQLNEERLRRMLPDNVDNIRLIVDMDGIAALSGMRLGNVGLQASGPTGNNVPIGPASSDIESVVLRFSVTGSYEQAFIPFMRNLERSLRIIDIEDLTITPGEGGVYEYSLAIRTYWLK